ncbi:hypothetical protein SCHPADRAFT_841275, partial [Schizopora paradoxa]
MIDLVLTREHHGLIIQPTGSGKTLAVLLPAIIENDGLTVFIIPFVGLLADMKKRLSSHPRIRWVTFPANNIDLDNTNVVLMQVEVATLEPAFTWLQQAASCGKLNRIVIDEIHLAQIDFLYRDSILRLHTLSAV